MAQWKAHRSFQPNVNVKEFILERGGWWPLLYLTTRIYLARPEIVLLSRKGQDIVKEFWNEMFMVPCNTR